MFLLADANNFYVSAERVFQPSLLGRPVVVLSNNQGCAVCRSEEAKALGVKMGQPWFEFRHLERECGLVALPSNYPLYADMSDRMQAITGAFGPRQEIYSIDEVFQDYNGVVHEDLAAIGQRMRDQVLRLTGLAMGMGFGPTKTLAKLANHIAKAAERKPGSYPVHLARVCNLGAVSVDEREAYMAATPVRNVWGVGPRIEAQLVPMGITTALALSRMDANFVRQQFSVVLQKTVFELRGVACFALDEQPAPKQQIMVSRSFGCGVPDLYVLSSAVTAHASTGAQKLRAQHSMAGALVVFIRTSPFRTSTPQHSATVTVQLEPPTDDSAAIAGAAIRGLHHIFREGFSYAKAGVMLLDLSRAGYQQGVLDPEPAAPGRPSPIRDRSRLMLALDTVNARFGRGTLQLGTAADKAARAAWAMRKSKETPGFTTDWRQLPEVHC